MFQLFESIRIEGGVVQNLVYHQLRVDRSIGRSRIDLLSYISNLEIPTTQCFKLRITYCEQGILTHTITPYVARTIRTLQLVSDDSIHYDKKYEERNSINQLYAQRGLCDDILIVRRGVITDASFANVLLFDGDRWVTPIEPLLRGTHRARLIDSGIVAEKLITVDSLTDYSKILLINAMIDFDPSSALDILSILSLI